jgi:hypothetical protein
MAFAIAILPPPLPQQRIADRALKLPANAAGSRIVRHSADHPPSRNCNTRNNRFQASASIGKQHLRIAGAIREAFGKPQLLVRKDKSRASTTRFTSRFHANAQGWVDTLSIEQV